MERFRSEQELLEEDLRRDGISAAAEEIQKTVDPPQHSEHDRRCNQVGSQQRLSRGSGDAVSRLRQVQTETRIRSQAPADDFSDGLRHHESAAKS